MHNSKAIVSMKKTKLLLLLHCSSSALDLIPPQRLGRRKYTGNVCARNYGKREKKQRKLKKPTFSGTIFGYIWSGLGTAKRKIQNSSAVLLFLLIRVSCFLVFLFLDLVRFL